jgi:transposase
MRWTTELPACPPHPQPLRRRLRPISLKRKDKSYLNFDPNCVLTTGSTLDFKAERVLETLTGELTLAEICREYLLLPQQLSEWKAEFLANAALVFQRDAESEILAARVAELERHVGRLTLDLEASKKVSRLLTSPLHRNGRS